MGALPEGYLLSSYAATLASGERARVVPGNPVASELVRRIRGQARPRMPYDGPALSHRCGNRSDRGLDRTRRTLAGSQQPCRWTPEYVCMAAWMMPAD